MLDRFRQFWVRSRSVRTPSSRASRRTTSRACELSIDDPRVENGILCRSAQLSIPGKEPEQIWFKLPARHLPAPTRRADPFILAALFPALESGAALRVTGGSASPSLLDNLAQFERVWHAWRGFDIIDIEAETEAEGSAMGRPALACFSGGIDSAYTAYRHAGNRSGDLSHGLGAALMVHGFDIPLDDAAGFERAAERSRRMLDSLGVPLVLMQTNIRRLYPKKWEMCFGAALAAALTVLREGFGAGLTASEGFGAGLIAGSGTDRATHVPWGSTPLTDPMLGSRDFPITHDGGAATRLDKVRALCAWPEALPYLRFCWQGDRHDGNCGRCSKCILTALEFRVCGVEPGCFAAPVTDDVVIKALKRYKSDPFGDILYREVLDTALAQGMTDAWVNALQRAVGSGGPKVATRSDR
jgi:hypothetical protein